MINRMNHKLLEVIYLDTICLIRCNIIFIWYSFLVLARYFPFHTKYNTKPNKNGKDVFGQGYIIESIFIIFSLKPFSLSCEKLGKDNIRTILLFAQYPLKSSFLWKCPFIVKEMGNIRVKWLSTYMTQEF